MPTKITSKVFKKVPVTGPVLTFKMRIQRLGRADRFGSGKPVSGAEVAGAARNGVQYRMSRTAIHLGQTSVGASGQQADPQDLVVCKRTPMQISREILGPLAMSGYSSQNASVIYPGATFKDSDVVRGIFTPLYLTRTPGSLSIDVQNDNGSVVVDVPNFDDRAEVVSAINDLRNEVETATSNVQFTYREFQFKASSAFNVELDASMEANLQELIGLPVNAGASVGGGLLFEQGANLAVAAVEHVSYMITAQGAAGPASTFKGTVPANAVMVTDVLYGRRAFVAVASLSSRAQASVVLGELLSLSAEGVTLVEANRKLSAEAKAALETGQVFITITGGNPKTAVKVANMATLRQYIEEIDAGVVASNAYPIAYTLRYAADNAPALVGAFADFVDRECFRASQVKVTLAKIKAVKVVDLGKEELYGTIKVKDSGNVTVGDRTLWSREANQAVQAGEGEDIVVGESATFNINGALPADHHDTVKVAINLKDRIEMGPEWSLADDGAKARGHVIYGEKTVSTTLRELKDTPSGKKTKVGSVYEGNARVDVTLEFELLGP